MNNAERAREKLTEELNGTEVKKEETNIASKKEEEKRLRERLKEYAEKRALNRLQRFCRARNLLAKQKSQSMQADLLDEAESIFILNKHVKLGKTKALVLVMMDKNKQNMNFNLRNIAAPRNLIVLPWSTQEFDSVEGLNLLRVKASILSNKLLKENVQVIKGGGYKWKDEPAPIITAPVVEKPMEDPAPVTEPNRPLENTDNQENFFDDDFEDQLEGEKKSEQKLVEPTKSEHQEEPNFFDDSVKEETKPVPEVKQQIDEKYHESEVQASEKIQVYRGKRARQHVKGKKADISDVKIFKHNDKTYLFCIRNVNLEEYQACCECLSTKQKYTPTLVFKRDYDFNHIVIDHENSRVEHRSPKENNNKSRVSEQSEPSIAEEFKLLKRRALVYEKSTYSISANRKLTEPAILLRLVDVKNKQFKDEILISIEQEMNDEEYQRRASVELNKCFLDLDFDQNLRIFRKEPEPPVELLASRAVGETSQRLELVSRPGEHQLEVQLRSECRVLDRMEAQWRPRATEQEYLVLLDEYSVKHGRIVREEEEDELNINRHGQFDELNHQTLTIPQNLGQQRHLTEDSDEGSLPDAESDPERFKQKTIYDEFANKDSHKSQATSQSRIRDYADDELRNEYKLKCPPLLQVTISQNKWKRKFSVVRSPGMQSLIMWVQDEETQDTVEYLQLKYDEFNLQDDIPVRDVKLKLNDAVLSRIKISEKGFASVEPNRLFDWKLDEYSDHGEDYEEDPNSLNPIPGSLKPELNLRVPPQDSERKMDQLDSAEGTSRNLLEDKDELRAGSSIMGDPSRDKVKEEEHLMSSEEIFTDEGEKENSLGRSVELQEDPRMVRGDPDSSNQILFENNEELPDSQGQDEKTKPDPISANLDEINEASEENTDNEEEEELTDKPALFKLMEDEGISWIELFYMIDVKKRGSISGMELYLDLVREMGCTKPLAYQILKEIDLDMDAFITVNEWISYENKLPKDLQQNSVHKGADIIQKLLVQLKANDMRVLEVFKEASQYEDVSQLSTIVLMRFLTDTLNLSKTNAKNILQEVDLDQDGFITSLEWIEYMKKKLDQSENHQFNPILSKEDLYKPLKDEIQNVYCKKLASKLNSGGIQLSGLVEYARSSAQVSQAPKPKLVGNLEDLVKENAKTAEISPHQKRRSLLTDSRIEKSDRESKLSASEIDGKKEGTMTLGEKKEEFRKWAREIQWNQEFEFTSVLCKQFMNGQTFFSQKEIYQELRKIDTDGDGVLTRDEWYDYFDKRDLHKYERTAVPAEIVAKEAKMYRKLVNTLVSRRLNIFKVFQDKAEGKHYLYISQLGAALLEHLPIELEETIYFGLSHACRSRTGFITYSELKRMFNGLCDVFPAVYSEPSLLVTNYEETLLEIKGLSVLISSFRFLIYTSYLEKLEELTKVIGGEQIASWNKLYHFLRPLIIEKKNAIVNMDKSALLTIIKLMDGNSDGFMHKWVWDYTMHSSYDDYFYSLLDLAVFKSNVEREVQNCRESIDKAQGTNARILALDSCLEEKGLTCLEQGFIADSIFTKTERSSLQKLAK